jgi:hypothetical protein
MRGSDERSGELFSYVDLEDRVPAKHPLRLIRRIVNEVLVALDSEFTKCYSACKIGSDSLLMKFADGVALIWRENQRHASTSAAVLTGAERLRRGHGGP